MSNFVLSFKFEVVSFKMDYFVIILFLQKYLLTDYHLKSLFVDPKASKIKAYPKIFHAEYEGSEGFLMVNQDEFCLLLLISIS